MSFSPMSHRQPLAMGGSRDGAPRKCRGGLGGAAPPRMLHLYNYFILQYFQIHRLYQNGWSFSMSRCTSYTKMAGLSVFPDSQVLKIIKFSIFPGPNHIRTIDKPISHYVRIILGSFLWRFHMFSHFGPELQF